MVDLNARKLVALQVCSWWHSTYSLHMIVVPTSVCSLIAMAGPMAHLWPHCCGMQGLECAHCFTIISSISALRVQASADCSLVPCPVSQSLQGAEDKASLARKIPSSSVNYRQSKLASNSYVETVARVEPPKPLNITQPEVCHWRRT